MQPRRSRAWWPGPVSGRRPVGVPRQVQPEAPQTPEVVMEQQEAGSVVGIWRYPVKSMMGEELNSSEVTERGLLGDRAYGLMDRSTGKVASAKNPRRWPALLDLSSRVRHLTA